MSDDSHTIADPTVLDAGAPGASAERAQLVVYTGEGAEARSSLVAIPDGSELTVGRSRASTVHVDSERVSRTHARIRRRGATITLEDLGSRNGTRVNGEVVRGEVVLDGGDEIHIGPMTAVVSVTSGMLRRALVGSSVYLDERLEAETDRGRRYHRPIGLVMLRLEGEGEDVDAAVDQVAEDLRPMDVLAEYGPDDYAVMVPEADRAATEQVARRALQRVADSGSVVARAGIAVFPDHGTQAGTLLSRAREAVGAARGLEPDTIAEPPDETSVADNELILADPKMKRVYGLVKKVADHPITVLIRGETGSGKEVVAEALHRASSRRENRFLKLNCASIPENLLESEMFGHEKGSFTGADRRKLGYFEVASGGTLFLDEIGEIAPAVQAKLLRVLEQRTISRVGGTEEVPVDVRVVCATHRDLDEEVRAGRFREDLFFRISAFTIVVPPLRDRPSEIPLLANHFANQLSRDPTAPPPTISPAAMDRLRRYRWPGNVRELRNAIERAVVLQERGIIDPEHLPERVVDGVAVGPAVGAGAGMRDQLADVERASIEQALAECGGNQTQAARTLGISRRSLIYKLEKYGLKPKPKSQR